MRLMPVILAMLFAAAFELALAVLQGALPGHTRCYTLVIIVALGAYAAHIRTLYKLGLYDGENEVKD